MNFEVLFQLAALALIVVAGPMILALLAVQEDNGL